MASRTPRHSASAARRLRGQLTSQNSHPVALPPELAELLERFQPRPPLRDLWPVLAPVVTEVMARSRIRGDESFRKYVTHLGYFLAWAHQQGLPLTVTTVVRMHTDEYTRTGMPASSPKSRADRRARLRWLADQVNPAQAPDKGVTVPRPTVKPPYTEPELTQLVRVALTQPSAHRTRKAALCIGLGAGAGLDSPDFRDLRAQHLIDHGARGIEVQVPGPNPRTVPVLRRFENLVRRGIADLPPDQLVLGRLQQRRNLAANALADVVVLGDCPRIEQSRLRATWLATLMSQPVPLGVLLRAAGLRSARTLPDLLPHLPAINPELAAQALRGMRGQA